MTLRFGVVGTAHWASEIHLPGLSAAGFEVAGLWGRTPAKTEAVAARKGVRAFPRLEDLLAACDAVTIAVPPEAQVEIAIRAASAGKHLILEKPIAPDLAGARRIAEAVAQARVAALVFLTRRFIPEIAAAIEGESDHPWTHANIRVHSSAMVTESPYAGSLWRQEAGAALWDIGPHALSVLVPMMGRVTAIESRPATAGISAFRSTHAKGGIAEVSMSLHSPEAERGNDYRFRSDTREILLPDPAFSRPGVFAQAARALAEAVRSGEHGMPCGLELGVDTVGWLEKAERDAAMRTGVDPRV